MQLSDKGLKPTMSLSVGNQLNKHFTGYCTYTTSWRIDESDDVRQRRTLMSLFLIVSNIF